jgi:four helix bundle protein
MGQVLIIDDDEHVTRLLDTHLSEEGHKVAIAHDGEQGMALAQKIRPDLIMLDVFLGDATGYQMCNRLRKNPSTRTTPIIMMTGAARFPNQQNYGRERGANEYIFKPFNIVEVGELVHKYLKPAVQMPVAEPASELAPAPEPEREPESNLVALNSIFKQALGKELEATPEEVKPNGSTNGNGHGNGAVIPPLSTPLESIESYLLPPTKAEQAAPKPEPQAGEKPVEEKPAPAYEETGPVMLAAKERFTELGLEIYGMATRMTSNRAETYLAEQMLRTSLSVGARINESRTSPSHKASLMRLQEALKDLRETGYWLMLAKRVGLLDALGKPDLEPTCQSLITLLADFIRSEYKKLPR